MSIIVDKPLRYVCTILINNVAKRNALDRNLIGHLQDAFRKFDDDDDSRVAVLGGVGGHFCAGYDLNEIIDTQTRRINLDNIKQMLLPVSDRLSRKKLVVAAVEGHAAGFGLELALRCDFRVGDFMSRMGFMNRRFGIPIMNGGTVILPQLIGRARAVDLIATGKAAFAADLLSHGLLHHQTDVGCCIGKAVGLARSVSKFDQSALLHDLKNLSECQATMDLLQRERDEALSYLERMSAEPFDMVHKFLTGESFRHGKYDMGNMVGDSEVTL